MYFSKGHNELLQILLESGGNPNVRDSFGISPVFTSAACGRKECLALLLESGEEHLAGTNLSCLFNK